MFYLILFSLIVCSHSFSRIFTTYKTGSSYGNFDDGIFNSKRNEYFWKDNTNIVAINKEKARAISDGWRISHIDKDSFPKNNFIKFNEISYDKSCLCYKWVPLNDRNDIRGLVIISLDIINKIIFIRRILPNPYISSFDIEYLKSDIEQIKFQDGFKLFEISYEKFIDNNYEIQ